MFFLSLFLTHAAWGNVISYGEHRFEISYPADWKEVKDFFGIPVTLLGPFQKNDARPVIQIIPTKTPPMKMTQEELLEFNKNYESGRKKWVGKNNGKLFEVEKAKLTEDKKGYKILSAGVSYQVNFKSYIEKTFYINCPKNLFNLKIVLNKGNKDFLPKALEIVRSFECGK